MGRRSIVPKRWRQTRKEENIWDMPWEEMEKEHKSLARRGSNRSSISNIDRGASYPPGTTNQEGYDANPSVMANLKKVHKDEAEEEEKISPEVTTVVSDVSSSPAMTKMAPLSPQSSLSSDEVDSADRGTIFPTSSSRAKKKASDKSDYTIAPGVQAYLDKVSKEDAEKKEQDPPTVAAARSGGLSAAVTMQSYTVSKEDGEKKEPTRSSHGSSRALRWIESGGLMQTDKAARRSEKEMPVTTGSKYDGASVNKAPKAEYGAGIKAHLDKIKRKEAEIKAYLDKINREEAEEEEVSPAAAVTMQNNDPSRSTKETPLRTGGTNEKASSQDGADYVAPGVKSCHDMLSKEEGREEEHVSPEVAAAFSDGVGAAVRRRSSGSSWSFSDSDSTKPTTGSRRDAVSSDKSDYVALGINAYPDKVSKEEVEEKAVSPAEATVLSGGLGATVKEETRASPRPAIDVSKDGEYDAAPKETNPDYVAPDVTVYHYYKISKEDPEEGQALPLVAAARSAGLAAAVNQENSVSAQSPTERLPCSSIDASSVSDYIDGGADELVSENVTHSKQNSLAVSPVFGAFAAAVQKVDSTDKNQELFELFRKNALLLAEKDEEIVELKRGATKLRNKMTHLQSKNTYFADCMNKMAIALVEKDEKIAELEHLLGFKIKAQVKAKDDRINDLERKLGVKAQAA